MTWNTTIQWHFFWGGAFALEVRIIVLNPKLKIFGKMFTFYSQMFQLITLNFLVKLEQIQLRVFDIVDIVMD